MDQLRILNVAQADKAGGANLATFRLNRALAESGVNATLWVGQKTSSDPAVVAACKGQFAKARAHAVAYTNSRLPKLYRGYRDSFYSTTQLTYGRLDASLLAQADVVCLNWIAGGFLSPAQLSRIRQPIVWQLWDAWPFTGGCHYPGQCAAFQTSCGPCPALGSSGILDLARLDFAAKRRGYRDLDLTLVAPSNWLAEQARRSTLFNRRRVDVIPSGVDLSVFRPHDKAMARDVLGLPRDRKLILFGAAAATTDRRKGYHLLPDVMRRLAASPVAAGATLVIFGGPGRRETTETTEFGLPVIHLGRFEDEVSLALLYSAADVLVAPYLEDNLPFVILEALACATPVAAFVAGGIPDAIAHQRNGTLAPVGDTTALADNIAWMLEDAERHAQLCRAANASAQESFDIRTCAARFRDLFSELTARSRGRSA
jgi:glycosyltransferase involved in cell wall biosynthesis